MGAVILTLDPLSDSRLPVVRGQRVEPGTGAAARLYRARKDLVLSLDAQKHERFIWLDDADDVLTDAAVEFAKRPLPDTIKLVRGQELRSGNQLFQRGSFSYADFARSPPTHLHHGIICDTRAAQQVDWPDGCYWFEGVLYGALARQGVLQIDEVFYEWTPSANGASTWADTARALVNTMRWLNGLPGVHFPTDYAGFRQGARRA
jgi:hypothetical protein